MSNTLILTRLDNRVLTLTLNRPDRMNALNPPLLAALREQLEDAADDARVGCVVLTGAGKGFCAGGDISAAAGRAPEQEKTPEQLAAETEQAARNGPYTLEYRMNWLRGNMEAARLLHEMPKPTIASVNGAAAGAGFALAMACDFRIVSEHAKFITSFIQVGLSGDFGGTYFLTKLVGPMKARELYLLSDRIDAQEADRLGLVTKLAPADELESQTMTFATRLANGPGIAQRYMKAALNLAEHSTLTQVLDTEALYQARTGQTEDHKEAARAFFEKRQPLFKNT